MKWICDKCGKEVTIGESPYLQWWEDKSQKGGFQIIHHPSQGCGSDDKAMFLNDKSVCDMDVEHFLGSDGLAFLMNLMIGKDIEDKELFTEIVYRLHIPNYEEARKYKEEFQDDTSEEFPVRQDQLLDIIRKYGKSV